MLFEKAALLLDGFLCVWFYTQVTSKRISMNNEGERLPLYIERWPGAYSFAVY
jgi:hypothetical protein